ncbi:hypothetical protein C2W62_25860 [Candidatus Entotheonella serta]|nr:hypothetical protein C2W62_46705 [Candidatus Entotheonella serta]PON15055.1 hypothetical protein C2W62_25860 [Candidatus Entotheonella serta]
MAIDNLSNVIEEGWQMVFRPLATASGKGIEADDAAFKLMGAFTNGDAIPRVRVQRGVGRRGRVA